MGHTSLETTARYLHWDDDEIKQKVARIESSASEPGCNGLSDYSPRPADKPGAEQRIVHRLAEAAEAGDSEMVTALANALEAMAEAGAGV